MTQNNLELMRTLDDSWNAQDWDTLAAFQGHHRILARSGRADKRARQSQGGESVEFFKTFPGQPSD